ncbi:MAG TPA: hypothetical protein VG435_17170 [Acidimicrobiales bacterium]|jgi:uncharacterized protein YdeI (YjbR/CyaY-like superfamily)|nr:hypothetical protein [Acidimicrobiales bacterium]
MAGGEPEEVHVESRAEVRRWLEQHHGRPDGVWFVFVKGKGRTIDYGDVVDEAVCFGWVDSRSRSYDGTRTSLYLAPRRPTSAWSTSNVERVQRLTAAGLMTPAGVAAVEAAKESGRWPVPTGAA